MAIYQSVNKDFNQVDFKIHCSGNVSGSSVRSNVDCQSVARRSIYINTAGQREIDLVGTHPRIPQMSFHNG